MKKIIIGIIFISIILSCNQKQNSTKVKVQKVENTTNFRKFKSDKPVEAENPITIVETMKNDSSQIELFILQDNIYLNFESKKIDLKNVNELKKFCQKNKTTIQKKQFVIIMEQSTDQNLVLNFISALQVFEINNIVLVTKNKK